MKNLVATFDHGQCKAEVYEAAMPGQFSVAYFNGEGKLLGEEPLTGVSSYKQREKEIAERLQEFCEGRASESASLAASGEY